MSTASALPEPAITEPPVDATGSSPFRFLDYYSGDDEVDFVGREDDIQEILAGLLRARAYALYGRSGLGKTSILLAGLVPRIRERGFECISLRVLASPIEDLCAAIASATGEREVTEETAAEILANRPKPTIVILDQFEEFFIRFRRDRDQRQGFSALLGKLVEEAGGRVRVLFSLREDYFAELSDFHDQMPYLAGSAHRLTSLTAYGARQAIVRPLIRRGFGYEERLIAELVDELAAYEFDPLLLQITCSEVFEEARADDKSANLELRAVHLARRGGVRGALARYVAKVGEGFVGETRLVACAVLDALTTAENTKRVLRLADLLADGCEEPAGSDKAAILGADPVGPLNTRSRFYLRASDDELQAVLSRLREGRLVREVRHATSAEIWYELLHDRLVPVINEWLERDPDFDRFRFAKKLVAALSAGKRWRTEPGGLLSDTQLEQQIKPWAARLRLDALETEHVFRSVIQERLEDVAPWAQRYEQAAKRPFTSLVIALMTDRGASVRHGAVAAVRRLDDPERRLVDPCFGRALEDLDSVVRREAGQSLATLVGPAELGRLSEALGNPVLRANAMEVLTDVAESNRPMEGLAWLPRRLAKRMMRKRFLHRHRDAIRERAGVGALWGLATAAIWVAVVAPPMLGASLFLTHPKEAVLGWPLTLLVFLAGVASGCLPSGAFWGWRAALRGAQAEALVRTASPFGRAFRGLEQTAWTFIVACFLAEIMRPSHDQRTAIVILGPGLCWIVGPALARFTLRTLAPEPRSELQTAAACVVSGTGLSLLAVLPIAALGARFGWSGPLVVVLAVEALLSARVAVAVAAHASAASRLPINPPPPTAIRARRRARALVLFGFVATIAVFVGLLGTDWLPFLAPPVAISRTGVVNVPEGRGFVSGRWPTVHYHAVRAEGADYLLSLGESEGVVIERDEDQWNAPLREGADALFAVHAPLNDLSPITYQVPIRARVIGRGVFERVHSEEWVFAWATLHPRNGEGQGSGTTLEGRLTEGSFDRRHDALIATFSLWNGSAFVDSDRPLSVNGARVLPISFDAIESSDGVEITVREDYRWSAKIEGPFGQGAELLMGLKIHPKKTAAESASARAPSK